MSQHNDLPDEFESLFQQMWGISHYIASKLDDNLTIERFLERERVKSMLTKFTYFYDGHDSDKMMTLFHPDCRLVNPRGTYRGIDAIRRNYEYLMSQPVLRFHGASNVSVAIEDDESTAWLFGYLMSVGGGPTTWTGVTGTYTIHLVKVDGDWKFRNLRMTANVQTHDGQLTPIQTRPPAPDENVTVTDWLGPGWVR